MGGAIRLELLGNRLFWSTIPHMAEIKKRCMVCAKEVAVLKGGICEPCQERIRREALGEQAGMSDRSDRELARHGVNPTKK